MNILHIISAPASGGAEVYVKDLAKALSIQGHEVHIAFLSHAIDIGRSDDYEASFLVELGCSNIHTFFIGNEARKMPWLGIIRINNYVKNNNIDICHAHLSFGAIFAATLNIPVMYTQHSIKPRFNKRFYPIFNHLITKYIGISEICSSSLKAYTGQEVVTINNAVSESKFKGYTKERILPCNEIVIAMVGRLDEAKDYLTMLRSLVLLDNNILNRIKILVAGEGELSYKETLLSFVNEKNLNNNVQFVGLESDIVNFLYNADIFLMSSVWEGLPIALIEATMSGLPCIVTDVGGCREVIENCGNGLIVPSSNPKALADALSNMISRPKELKEYSINALNNSSYYSIDKAANQHIKLYEKFL